MDWPTNGRTDRPSYTHFFLYKHNVYKHIQAEILHFFKHNAKHIQASDFGCILVNWYIYKIIINKHIAKHISAWNCHFFKHTDPQPQKSMCL